MTTNPAPTRGDGIKLYFRFKGVPLDREGGAWWDRTYYSSYYKSAAAQRQEFLGTMKPFLAAWAFDSIDNEVLAEGEPPKTSKLCPKCLGNVAPGVDRSDDCSCALQENAERKRAYIEDVIKPEFPLGARVRVIDSDERCYVGMKGVVTAYSPGIDGEWPGIRVTFDADEVPNTRPYVGSADDIFWFEEIERLNEESVVEPIPAGYRQATANEIQLLRDGAPDAVCDVLSAIVGTSDSAPPRKDP